MSALGAEHQLHLFPFLPLDGVLTALIFFGAVASVVGGIGGGGLFVPLIILCLYTNPIVAVPISKCVIFFSSCVALIDIIRKGMVPLTVCAQLAPMILSGTLIGVVLNIMLPSTIIQICMSICLAFITYKTFTKFSAHRAKERLTQMEHHQSDDIEMTNAGSNSSIIDGDARTQTQDQDEQNTDQAQQSQESGPHKATKKKRENLRPDTPVSTRMQLKYAGFILLIWLVYLGFSVFRKYSKPCSAGFFAALACPVLISVGATIVFHHYYPADPIYALGGLFGGILSGALGIGGGMVLGPMLIYMKVEDPILSSSLSTVLVLLTSSSTTLQFVLFGTLHYDYGLWLAGWACVASAIGRFLIRPRIEKHGKSYILFFLAIIIALSCALTLFKTVDNLVENQVDWKFHMTLCELKH